MQKRISPFELVLYIRLSAYESKYKIRKILARSYILLFDDRLLYH